MALFDLTECIGLGAEERFFLLKWRSNPAICIPQSQVITGFPMAPTSPLSSTLNSGISNSIAQKQHGWWLQCCCGGQEDICATSILAEAAAAAAAAKQNRKLCEECLSVKWYHQQSSILHLNLITLIKYLTYLLPR